MGHRKLLLGVLWLIASSFATAAVNEWTPIGPYAEGGSVRSLVVARNGDVFVGSTIGLSVSRDGGLTWESAVELMRETVASIAIDPRFFERIYVGTDSGVFRSDDSGRSWSKTSEGLAAGLVSAIAVDPALSTTVYGLVLPIGLFRSTDSGAHWSRVSSAPFSVYQAGLAIAPTQPPTLYLATPEDVYRSRDAGMTWTLSNAGQPSVIGAFAIDPATPTTVYVAGVGSVLRTTDGGASWARLMTGFPAGASVDSLTISATASGTLYALSGNRIYSSVNGGTSWQGIGNPPTGAEPLFVALDPRSSNVLYVGTVNLGVLQSSDAGRTWVARSAFRSFEVADLALTATFPPRLVAVGDPGVAWTGDEGAHWFAAMGLPPVPATSIAVDRAGISEGPSPMYVGTLGSGVFRSLDGRSLGADGGTDRTEGSLGCGRRFRARLRRDRKRALRR